MIYFNIFQIYFEVDFFMNELIIILANFLYFMLIYYLVIYFQETKSEQDILAIL